MDGSRTPPRIECRLQALKLAQACAELGARVRTIAVLTGLPARELLELLFPDRQAVPRGRPPESPDWYHTANLLYRTEASIAMALYRRLREADIGPAEALVGAYRQYRGVCEPPHRISFDRAFDLAGHTDGLWFTSVRSFSLVACPGCHSTFLAAYGAIALSNDECPFCKLVQRYGTDTRVQASFPVRPLADLSGVPLGVRELLRASAPRSAADLEGGDSGKTGSP
ncbi:FlhC family transcriptional regulator [Azohydromonas australica]|uniref:FlhC family transcriptional regulator n=1 Tax=Azohydromonas australica TaxID=364039 RepID=UPI00041F8813|nr:FlhC family transcriptional regulator [Azohydromonas australica]